MKPSRAIPLSIIFGGVVIAVAVYLATPKAPAPTTLNIAKLTPVRATDHIMGNPAAPVKIIEYCDFESSYCKTLDVTLRQIMADNGASGKVAWVYRQFPVLTKHPNALSAAEAAECAAKTGGNDAFWRFTNQLFTHQPTTPSQYGTLAANAGLPGTAFASCYANASTTVLAAIQADSANANAMKAPGVPFSLLVANGQVPQVMLGTYPYVAIQQLISEALSKLNQGAP